MYFLDGGRPGSRKGTNQKLSRKEARKQEREQKKVRKANYFTGHDRPVSSASGTAQIHANGHASAKGKGKETQAERRDGQVVGMKRQADKEHAQSPKRKRVKFAEDTKSEARPSAKENATPGPSSRRLSNGSATEAKKKQSTALQRLVARTESSSRSFSAAVSPRKGSRTKQEKEEDAYIAYLEKKLGWSKGGSRTGKYGKGLEEDGLDGAAHFLIFIVTCGMLRMTCRQIY